MVVPWPDERTDLVCPECQSPMVLRRSKYKSGAFYACEKYPKCSGTHSAHSSGAPLGTPANKETKLARMRAHTEFDKLWKEKGLSRRQAYFKLQAIMHMNDEEAHIAKFTKEDCETLLERLRLIRLAENPVFRTADIDKYWKI